MKVNIIRNTRFLVDFISINGFYFVISLFILLNLNIESRLYTIPLRALITLSMVLLMLWKSFKPCHNSVIYILFILFFFIYWTRIILEIILRNHDLSIPWYEYLLYSIVYGFVPFIYYSRRKTEIDFEQIFRAILVSGIMFSIIILILFFKTKFVYGFFDRYFIRLDPLTLSYCGSLTIGICISRLLSGERNINSKFLIMGILLAICPFLIGGSRGPVIALIISLLLVFAIKTKLFINRKHLKYVLLIILILVLGVATFGDVAFARLSNLLDDIASKSQDVKRIWIWETAFKQFLRSPVIGDSIQIEGVDYPHNLILEVLMSTGLIGFIPFFTLIIYGIYRSIQIIKNSKSLVWVCIFFYQSFMMGMISGNVYSSIWFWSSLAMVLSADLSTEDKYNT